MIILLPDVSLTVRSFLVSRVLVLGLLLSWVSSAGTATEAPVMSAAALKAEKSYQDSLLKIQKSAYAKLTKAKEPYAKSLEKEMKAQLRDHGIGAANEVQVIITELEMSDPLAKTFAGVEIVEPEVAKPKIKVERAYGRRMRGQVWDVTKEVQKLVDEGKRSFRACDELAGETGFDLGGQLEIQWTFDGKECKRSFAWRQTIDFDAIAVEENK